MYNSKTKVFAIFNQAGGCGKTTISHQLGYHLAQANNKVLLIDFDPQASLTLFMSNNLGRLSPEKTVYQAVMTEGEDIPIWSEKIYGMELLPGHIALAAAEKELRKTQMIIVETILEEMVKSLDYDYIIVDCPPSPDILNVMALKAATHVIVPVQTQFKCFAATEALLNTLQDAKKKINKDLQFGALIPVMYDGRLNHENDALEKMKELVPKLLSIFRPASNQIYMSKPVPRTTTFAEASVHRMPLAVYNRNQPAVAILNEITNNIIKL